MRNQEQGNVKKARTDENFGTGFLSYRPFHRLQSILYEW